MVLILFTQRVWPLTVVMSKNFALNSSINSSLLLIKYLEAHESIYQVSLKANI